MDQQIRQLLRAARAGDEAAWARIEMALQGRVVNVPPTHCFRILYDWGGTGNADIYYVATRQDAARVLYEIAAEQLRQNGDGDMVAGIPQTIKAWVEVFDPAFRIERIDFSQPTPGAWIRRGRAF